MNPVESVLYMAWRGFAIGVLISAPMGPVGMLCIQRTLDKGRRAGFYTGIGAAISDLIYCLITGFFLSLIEDFLQENQNVIQLFGSLVLIAFSIYLFKKSPSASLRRPVPQNVSAKKNILGGFLFTFSNPLIIFLIIGLFARFNFSAPEINGGFYAIGYVFLVGGALAWWYGVTYLIEKVRAKFNMRSMKRLNIAIGIVILAFACVGIVTSLIGLISSDARAAKTSMPPYLANTVDPVADAPLEVVPDARFQSAMRFRNDSSYSRGWGLIDKDKMKREAKDCNVDEIRDFRLDFKIANNASRPGRHHKYRDADGKEHVVKCPAWRLVLYDSAGNEMALQVNHREYSPSLIGSELGMFLTPIINGEEMESKPVSTKVAATGLNHFRVVYDEEEGISVEVGNHTLAKTLKMVFPECWSRSVVDMRIEAMPCSDISLLPPTLRLGVSPGARRTKLTPGDIEARIGESMDPTEGRWKMLDHTIEESKGRLGGEYTLDIVRRPDGVYEMVYHSGAIVNASAWEPGMIKGELHPTGHEGVYDLEWRDSQGLTLYKNHKAQRETPNIMTLHFPNLDSRIRFQRIFGQ